MVTRFIDSDRLRALASEEFRSQEPYPWLNERLLRPDGFDELCRDFPSLDRFEFHQDLARERDRRLWHGVRTLTCPEQRYRRLFNAIFEAPDGRPATLRLDE